MTPKPGTDFCPNCSETIANIRMRNSLIAELKRIIVLKGLKEKFQEPDCCDPRETGLPYWSETSEGMELERLMKQHFPEVVCPRSFDVLVNQQTATDIENWGTQSEVKPK